MPRTITINLPDKLYRQLERAAELSRQPTEAIVVQSLAHSLPPLLEDIPPEYQPDVYPLLQMSDADLQQEANRVFPADRWAEYEALLNKKKITPLTAEEQTRLDTLRREADVLTFRKRATRPFCSKDMAIICRRFRNWNNLSLNSELGVRARAIWVEAGWHPPE